MQTLTRLETLDAICGVIMAFEGCHLKAYPDPASPLGQALIKKRLWTKFLQGKIAIPADLENLSGKPWTVGYGETLGITKDTVWTLEHAKAQLRERVAGFMLKVYEKCPQLLFEPSGRMVGATSLAYNIGTGAFGNSSVCRHTMRYEYAQAAKSFLLWNKAQGIVLEGLNVRRKLEMRHYLLQFIYSMQRAAA